MEELTIAETPTEVLRRNIREIGVKERKERREKQVNSRRGILGEVLDAQKVFSPEEVKNLAEKLKHKGHINGEDYMLLSEALIQNEENIISFFKVSGALQSLIRDLTGQNASLQLGAAYCCCNLALGNEKSCLKLVKAAAAYLTINLDGLNNHIVEICTWTLGNLAGSDVKTWLILQSQLLLPKLLNLVKSSNMSVAQSAIYALTHYVRIGMDSGSLHPDMLANIAAIVSPLMEMELSSLWLLHLLSCFEECDQILLRDSLVSRSIHLLEECESVCDIDTDITKTIALVRILGNLCSGEGAKELLNMEISVVASIIKILLQSQYSHIKQETLWLIGNLFHHPSENVRILVRVRNLEYNLEPVLSEILSRVS